MGNVCVKSSNGEDVTAFVRPPKIPAFIKSHRMSAPMMAATATVPMAIPAFAPTDSSDPDVPLAGAFEAVAIPVVALGGLVGD